MIAHSSTVSSAQFQGINKMAYHLGIDTSNYTTSVSVFDDGTNEIFQAKKLLPVKEGSLGLRQSDAVFHHTVQLPMMFDELFENRSFSLSSVGVSVSPRDEEGSYMPCFLAGVSVAKAISNVNRIPLNTFSHQAGHIAAALYSSDSLDLMNEEFIAFHLSGGTTEALLVKPDKDRIFNIELVAKTLDLKAGQAIDRVGVMLGLQFPCGRELDKLSLESSKEYKIRPTMKGADCCLSGIENKCGKMIENGEKKEDVAKYCITYIERTLEEMTKSLIEKYGNLPLVYAGGVMSNTIISHYFNDKFSGRFALPEFSSDNAAGISILTSIMEKRK